MNGPQRIAVGGFAFCMVVGVLSAPFHGKPLTVGLRAGLLTYATAVVLIVFMAWMGGGVQGLYELKDGVFGK